MRRAEVLVVGAGIAGVSTAWQLAVRCGVEGVVLVDEREPLSLTSARGTEAYRNWWPGPDGAMVALMNRSIDLLEERARTSGNAIGMTRRGYAYLTASRARVEALATEAERVCANGAGPLRSHPGTEPWPPSAADGPEGPHGADLVLDPDAVRRAFPYVASDAIACLHVRRAGWLDARALGASLLAEARAAGVDVVRGRLVGVETAGGRAAAVRIDPGGRIALGALVLAPGPLLGAALAMLGIEIPTSTDLHGKAAFRDERGVVPRDAPLLVWCDPVKLAWDEREREELAGEPAGRRLLGRLPPAVHARPRGAGNELVVVWTYEEREGSPEEPPRFPRRYAEVLLRGLERMVPGAAVYRGGGAHAAVDGGWYCRVPDNRPLLGPLPLENAYACAALSGYGVMASQAAAELVAAHVMGSAPPAYASAFHPARFSDTDYVARLCGEDARAGEL